MTCLTRRSAITSSVAAAAATLFGNPAQLRAAKVHIVEIAEFSFSPATVNVRPGDTITWINRDIAPHTATAKDRSWDTGGLKRGEEASITVSDDMVEDYFCRFHPAMKATLKITAA